MIFAESRLLIDWDTCISFYRDDETLSEIKRSSTIQKTVTQLRI